MSSVVSEDTLPFGSLHMLAATREGTRLVFLSTYWPIPSDQPNSWNQALRRKYAEDMQAPIEEFEGSEVVPTIKDNIKTIIRDCRLKGIIPIVLGDFNAALNDVTHDRHHISEFATQVQLISLGSVNDRKAPSWTHPTAAPTRIDHILVPQPFQQGQCPTIVVMPDGYDHRLLAGALLIPKGSAEAVRARPKLLRLSSDIKINTDLKKMQ